MKAFFASILLALAAAPAATLADMRHFIAHVLTYGTHEDCETLRRHVDDAALRDAVRNAPPGIFDRLRVS